MDNPFHYVLLVCVFIFAGALLALGVYLSLRWDDNDRKQRLDAERRRTNLFDRINREYEEAKVREAEAILRHVAETGEMPKKRKTGRPQKSLSKGVKS